MFVRLSDDCSVMNMEFSLSGSTTAINFVYGEKAAEINKNVKEINAKDRFASGLAILDVYGKYAFIWEEPQPGDMVFQMSETDTVKVLSRKGDYFQVEIYDSIRGWFNKRFIIPIL